MSLNLTSLAVYSLFLFPALPLSAGVNGFLAQVLFSTLTLFPLLLRPKLPAPLHKAWVTITLYYVGLSVAMLLRGWANDMADYATLLRIVMPLAAMLAGYRIAAKSPDFIRRLLIFSTISLLVIYALVLVGVYSLADIWYFRDSSELSEQRRYYHIFRAAGFFGYPSEAAIILSMLLLVYVGRIGQWNRQTLLPTALVSAAVFATQSRAGLALLAVAIFILLLYLPGRKYVFVLLLAMAFGISNVSFTYLDNSFGTDVAQTNLLARSLELTFLKDVIFNGVQVGYGVSEYREFFGTLESNYLTLYLRGGVLAILIEATAMLLIGFLILRLRLSTPGHRAIRMFTGLIFLANGGVLDFFTGLYVQGKCAVVMWSLWGVVIMLARQSNTISLSRKVSL